MQRDASRTERAQRSVNMVVTSITLAVVRRVRPPAGLDRADKKTEISAGSSVNTVDVGNKS